MSDKGCLWTVGILIFVLALLLIPTGIPHDQHQANPKDSFTLAALGLISVALIIAVLFYNARAKKASIAEADSAPNPAREQTEEIKKALIWAAFVFAAVFIVWASYTLPDGLFQISLTMGGYCFGIVSLWACLSSALEAWVIGRRMRK